MTLRPLARRSLLVLTCLGAVSAGGAVRSAQHMCGPFTDVSPLFCPYVLEAYYVGITAGTSATTFSPDTPITRAQAAVFTTKGLDQAIARSSRRAALGQWWIPQSYQLLGITALPNFATGVSSDGADLWVSNGDLISRVRGSDGRLLENWNGPALGSGKPLVAMGRVFLSGQTAPLVGGIFMIDPSQAVGSAVSVVSFPAGDSPGGSLAFDGGRIWCLLPTPSGNQVAIVTPSKTLPWTYTTVSGFGTLTGILFDGANVWVSDADQPALLKLDAGGAIVQAVDTGAGPSQMMFDGANIWVPNHGDNSVTVVRAFDGTVVATLTGNGLSFPGPAAFDGQRVLVVNGTQNCVSLWKAADLSPLGCIPGAQSNGGAADVASDGVNFWLAIQGPNALARF